MSMLGDQVGAVLTAPIPFIIALAPIGFATWVAMEWAYRSVLNKRKELFELSRSEVAYWKDLAERTTNDATKQIEQLGKLLANEQDLTADAKEQITQLSETISRLGGQLSSLGQANSSGGLLTPVLGPGKFPVFCAQDHRLKDVNDLPCPVCGSREAKVSMSARGTL